MMNPENAEMRMYKKLVAFMNSQKDLQTCEICLKPDTNEDLMCKITALLEVCVMAIEGYETLMPQKNPPGTDIGNISIVLELVIQMLPQEQMFHLDKILEILAEQPSNPPDKA